jgi:hypothetical protein
MPFNSNGLYVASQGLSLQDKMAMQPYGSVPSYGGMDGGMSPTEWASNQQATEQANQLYTSAKTAISNNTPEWQAALQAYNTGQPVDPKFQLLIQNYADYGHPPGTLNAQTMSAQDAQWDKDNQPSMMSRFADVAAPLLIAATGASALMGAGAGALSGSNVVALDGAGTAAGTAGTTNGLIAASNAMAPTAAELATVGGSAMPVGQGALATLAGETGAGLTAGAGTAMATPYIMDGAMTAAGAGTTGALASDAAIANLSTGVGAGMTAAGTGGLMGYLTDATGLSANTIAGLGGTAASIGANLYGSNQASKAITDAANQANGLSQQAMKNQVPWMQAGQDALTSQYNLMGLGANGANGASGELTALQQSPGYQFGLSQGQRGLDAGVAARGGMGSGKAATAASQWNQNYANTGYNNRLTQLSGLSQVGQNAASGVGTQLNMQGSNTANAGLASANATMQGTIGAGNALSSFLNPNTLNQSTLGK